MYTLSNILKEPNYKSNEPPSSSCLYKGPRGALDILRPASQVVRLLNQTNDLSRTIWLCGTDGYPATESRLVGDRAYK
jgi:hypothetical protein